MIITSEITGQIEKGKDDFEPFSYKLFFDNMEYDELGKMVVYSIWGSSNNHHILR